MKAENQLKITNDQLSTTIPELAKDINASRSENSDRYSDIRDDITALWIAGFFTLLISGIIVIALTAHRWFWRNNLLKEAGG